MMPGRLEQHALRGKGIRLMLGLVGVVFGTVVGRAEELPHPSVSPEPPAARAENEAPMPRLDTSTAALEQGAPAISLADALRWTIEHNPQLALVRKQRGIARAGIVIANTYPFNPIVQWFSWGAMGPAPNVTNHAFNELTTRIDVEFRGQGRHRRAMAQAALSRTEWEIAAQEVLVAMQMVRAFDTVLYRQEKLRIQEDLLRLQEQVMEKVGPLVQQGHLSRTELMLSRADLVDAQTALGPARNQLVVAYNDLRRQLGAVEENFVAMGSLEAPLPRMTEADMVRAAEQRRPDLHALEVAVKEAQAALRLQIANRYGNPSIGPAGEINETSVAFAGMWLIWSPPVINTRNGEIQQRQADVIRAQQAVQSMNVTIRQDVQAALKRLTSARELIETYRTKTLPLLRQTMEGLDQLFARGEPGVTLARVIAIRHRLIQTRSAYLDALFEWSQARADLAVAVGDPSLALPSAAPALAASQTKCPAADAP